MKSFKQFILEKYTFGATAYGNADIDKTTAQDISKGKIKPEWQFLGNRNNKLIPGYSVANNVLPHGTIIRVTDKRTGKPVGASIGNPDGIFRVDDTGGKQVTRNIDFYSGSDKNMMNYFARYGTNSNNLNVETLNIRPGSPEEQAILSKLNTTANTSNELESAKSEVEDYNTPGDAATAMFQGVDMLRKGMNLGIDTPLSKLGMGGGIK